MQTLVPVHGILFNIAVPMRDLLEKVLAFLGFLLNKRVRYFSQKH